MLRGMRNEPRQQRPTHQPSGSANGSAKAESVALYLVSCVKTKGPGPAAAKELYQSAWFRKARAYVERTRRPWFILSAKHGLVGPVEVIEPYEQTLKRMPVKDQRQWADQVLLKLAPHLPETGSICFLAGEAYRRFLARELEGRGYEVVVPMAGLASGKQLAWLNRELHA